MAELKVEIGPREIYDKLVEMDRKADDRHADQAVINATVDMRIGALEKAGIRGWQLWLAIIGFVGGASGTVVALMER